MLDEREIRKEIARLEYEESSYPNYAKLADLYAIRREMRGGSGEPLSPYSVATSSEPAAQYAVGQYGDSDFLLAVSGKDPGKVWPIIDELMDTLAMVNKKVYDSVLRKIQNM